MTDVLQQIQYQLQCAKTEFDNCEKNVKRSSKALEMLQQPQPTPSPIQYINDLRLLHTKTPLPEMSQLTGVELVHHICRSTGNDYSGNEQALWTANQEYIKSLIAMNDARDKAQRIHEENITSLQREYDALESTVKKTTSQGTTISPRTLTKRKRKLNRHLKSSLSKQMKTRSKDSKTRNDIRYH